MIPDGRDKNYYTPSCRRQPPEVKFEEYANLCRQPFPPRKECSFYNARGPDCGWAGYPVVNLNAAFGSRTDPPAWHYVPMINLKDSATRRQCRSPFLNLVIHKQGVPLIQSNNKYKGNRLRWKKNNGKNDNSENNCSSGGGGGGGGNVKGCAEKVDKSMCQDSSSEKSSREKYGNSVGSDESLGNSENCLPRIIKPRKRRKKDRKPQQAQERPDEATSPTADASGGASKSAVEYSKDSTEKLLNLVLNENALTSFLFSNDLASKDNEELLKSCHCRYCDPDGLIWDIEEKCHSERPSSANLENFQQESDWSNGLLRRSWSEPVSGSAAELQQPMVGSRARTLSDSSSARRGFQISSEIVTSPDGHRDIEIKFYSTPATVVS